MREKGSLSLLFLFALGRRRSGGKIAIDAIERLAFFDLFGHRSELGDYIFVDRLLDVFANFGDALLNLLLGLDRSASASFRYGLRLLLVIVLRSLRGFRLNLIGFYFEFALRDS